MARVKPPINKERYISTILRELIPRLKFRSKRIAIAATVGIVRPILANADPSAKLRLL